MKTYELRKSNLVSISYEGLEMVEKALAAYLDDYEQEHVVFSVDHYQNNDNNLYAVYDEDNVRVFCIDIDANVTF